METIFQSCWDGDTASCVFISTWENLKCLAQGHYTAVVGFEPWTSRSGVNKVAVKSQTINIVSFKEGCYQSGRALR